MRVTSHAVARYLERAQRESWEQARRELQDFVEHGKVRPRPRSWTKHMTLNPGTNFMYCAKYPDVALIVRDGAAVTTVTRSAVKGWELNFKQGGHDGGRDTRRARVSRRRTRGEV